MSFDYDECRKNLQKLIHLYSSKENTRNEATTRFQLIDSLFFDCLGWEKSDVELEEQYNGEFTDYTFKAPRRVLIVEAKREGDYFEIPAGKTNIEYSLHSLMKDFKNVNSAIEQVSKYCQARGVPIGAVCNGHQIVAFIANRSDGLPPLEGKALVFPSLYFMLDHFLDLWQALSKPAIEEKKLQNRLLGDKLNTVRYKYC
jgi:predicted type IV restriction endonuclease